MIRINQIKCKTLCDKENLIKRAAKILKISEEQIENIEIIKQSIDARKKPEIWITYSINVSVKGEEKIVNRLHDKDVSLINQVLYKFPTCENKPKTKTIIVGAGPAGLFCAYFLAKNGFSPILLERGKSVDERTKDVEEFWKTGILNPNSNAIFGEGGAGTFSDGKLNTLVKDSFGRNKEVLRVFHEFGAPEKIQYEAKPHIGTDILRNVVKRIRKEIVSLGGVVRFEAKVTDLKIENNKVKAVCINNEEWIDCDNLVLAIGHSARETFQKLYEKQIPMEAKAFAVGFRVQHPQSLINDDQYGKGYPDFLPAASYKLTAKASNGRGVYSFCMCPGGYVVNASSANNELVVNGMSYSKRDGENANSAIIIAVTPEDYPDKSPLGGVHFQEVMEQKAFDAGNGKIPYCTYQNFSNKAYNTNIEIDSYFKNFKPQLRGVGKETSLKDILPEECNKAFIEGMEQFGKQIKGFNHPKTILCAVESRTSSPVRISRNEDFQSTINGIYPCGEGAGYAGGIMSAAMDGMKVAEAIALNTK